MAKWAVVVSAEQFELERLYAADTLTPPQPASLRTGAKAQVTGSGETLPTGGADAQATGGGDAQATGGDKTLPTGGADAQVTGGGDAQVTGGDKTLPTGGADAQVTGGGEAQVTGARGLATGDEALLVAATPDPIVFGLARVDATGALRYTLNLLDAPLPAGPLKATAAGVYPLDEPEFRDAASRLAHDEPPKRTWLVSVDLPIEASTPGEAVRAFWAYVRDLGPAELPAFVWPAGNELAMQAFVLGAESNQDPEED